MARNRQVCGTRTRLCSLAKHNPQQAIALASFIAIRDWGAQGPSCLVHNDRRCEIALATPELPSHHRLAPIFTILGVKIEAGFGLQF